VEVSLVSEYTSDRDVTRARSVFYNDQSDVLLYSGRAHFFRWACVWVTQAVA